MSRFFGPLGAFVGPKGGSPCPWDVTSTLQMWHLEISPMEKRGKISMGKLTCTMILIRGLDLEGELFLEKG